MDDPIDLVLLEDLSDTLIVTNILTYEEVIRSLLDIFKISQIARIGQFIQVDDAVVWILIHHQTDDM